MTVEDGGRNTARDDIEAATTAEDAAVQDSERVTHKVVKKDPKKSRLVEKVQRLEMQNRRHYLSSFKRLKRVSDHLMTTRPQKQA